MTDLPHGAKLYFIGLGGIAMSQAAALASLAGFAVSGSDCELYGSAEEILKRSAIPCVVGYRRENVPSDADMVVIGNAVGPGNVEIAEVEARRLRFTTVSRLLAGLLIGEGRSLIVAGAHGKTTTAALIAALLADRDPSFFFGSVSLSGSLLVSRL